MRLLSRHFMSPCRSLLDCDYVRRRLGRRAQQVLLQALDIEDLMAFEIDREHLSRTEAAFYRDALVIEVEESHFGTGDYEAVASDLVAHRTQSVTVEGSAYVASVGEGHRRRAIPRLHQRGVFPIETRQILKCRMSLPCRHHEHGHAVQQIAATAQERFGGFIQVRLASMVLISPLWAISLNGCASHQEGCVFVAYRWWKRTNELSNSGFCRSR